MTGEISYFRKRFFGGFNKQDVVDYIVKMAQERNGLEDEKNKITKDVQLFADEVSSLRKKINEMQRQMDDDREKKEAIFKTADNTCAELEEIFQKYIEEIEAAVAAINESFANAGASIAKVPETLAQAGGAFKELRTAFTTEISGVGKAMPNMDEDRSAVAGYGAFAGNSIAAGLGAEIKAAIETVADKAAGSDTASGEAEIFVA